MIRTSKLLAGAKTSRESLTQSNSPIDDYLASHTPPLERTTEEKVLSLLFREHFRRPPRVRPEPRHQHDCRRDRRQQRVASEPLLERKAIRSA